MSIWGKIGFKHYQTIYNHISYQGKNKRKSYSPKLFWKPLTFNFFFMPMICITNQLTGFYMKRTLAWERLMIFFGISTR